MYYMYVSKSCVEEYLKALVLMLVARLAFTKFAHKQVREQLCYSGNKCSVKNTDLSLTHLQ